MNIHLNKQLLKTTLLIIFSFLTLFNIQATFIPITKKQVIKAQATYYAKGKRTANGDVFRPYSELTCAAHKKYPFNTKLKVTNISNGKSIIVKVTDRGPFCNIKGRENDLDLSHLAFSKIANPSEGRINITVEKLN